ncbi:MAG: TIGR00725 family protein [Candidatus Marinimicrobia bacterium]|nr:TIGR00725 family protein [Candidatus Neomarinimicrobiota bacterium]MCF7902274.1 TIGR00725 family protein [Candidatus Neomarinimicrobiota bacterium]
MEKQQIRVGVIGAREVRLDVYEIAYQVGKLLAEKGALLYSGGRTGVMEAASKGAHDAGGLVVGILMTTDPAEANPWVDVPILTGMGDLRNGILVRSVDGLIAIDGAYGTLSEIAFTLSAGKPLVGLGSWEIEGMLPAKTPEDAVDQLIKALTKSGNKVQ